MTALLFQLDPVNRCCLPMPVEDPPFTASCPGWCDPAECSTDSGPCGDGAVFHRAVYRPVDGIEVVVQRDDTPGASARAVVVLNVSPETAPLDEAGCDALCLALVSASNVAADDNSWQRGQRTLAAVP